MRKYLHCLVFVVLLCAMPTLAVAHAFLDHASPRVGNTVATAPNEVVLWFTQKLEPAFSSIEVDNEQGASVTGGKAHRCRRSHADAGTTQDVAKRNIQGFVARTVGRYASHPGRL
jgi:methionine-rich copper-binding protein CopC